MIACVAIWALAVVVFCSSYIGELHASGVRVAGHTNDVPEVVVANSRRVHRWHAIDHSPLRLYLWTMLSTRRAPITGEECKPL